MARKYRKSRQLSQKQYRARLSKYEEYRSSELEPLSFKEWNAPYRQTKFLRREYRLYSKMFDKREKSARFGFRKDENGNDIQKYTYKEFKEYYAVTRNSLEAEVKMGERKRVGSVITEMVNDQAYELSAAKARAVTNYLLENEREVLIEKGIIIPNAKEDEGGNLVDLVKSRNLMLLIRQGDFLREDLGFWDEIKDYYKTLINEGYTTKNAKREIGLTYFSSGKKGDDDE